MLAIIQSQPVQYHAPVYRAAQTQFGVPITAIYGSDFSVAGYLDREFGSRIAWDTDLLSGYDSVFLSQVPQNGARGFDEVSSRGLRKALHRIAPKAVMVLGYGSQFDQSAFYEGLKTRRPILFRGETTDHARGRNPLKSFARDHALRWGYQRAARLLYIGKRSHAHFRRMDCPEEKLIFSPYCVDTSIFETSETARLSLREAARVALGIARDAIVLLFSGKLSRTKNPELLLRAVKRLPDELLARSIAVFLGDGELRKTLQLSAPETPFVETRFLGFKNQSQLSPYYHAADLLVFPSQGDTWGLVVNEALHHGLPCVVSDAVGCAPDLIEVGVTGYVFKNGSIDSLVVSLQSAFSLIAREDVRQSCRNKVSAYSVENAARGIAEAYHQVSMRG